MGKGIYLIGLILIITGFLPILMSMIGLYQIAYYFYILSIFQLDIGGFLFSDLMLILIGLGVVFMLIGIMTGGRTLLSVQTSRGIPQIILGLALIIVFLLTLTNPSIPIIWTGGAIVGVAMLISGIRDIRSGQQHE